MSDIGKSKTILYVEDDESNRQLVRKLLSTEGYRIIEAEDAITGIDMANEFQPNLVLMDMNMYGLDGYEAATRIKSIEACAHIPIIALTANVRPGDKEKSLIAGCNGYMTKPINVDSFVSELEEYIGGRQDILSEEQASKHLKEYSNKLVDRLEGKVRELSAINRGLEQRVIEKANEIKATEKILMQSEKMASIGQLAAGVAHEINNPVGYINSNLGTLKVYINDLIELIEVYEAQEESIEQGSGALEILKAAKKKVDLEYLKADVKDLVGESLEGVNRVKKIVQDLKDFSHEAEVEKEWTDLHKCLDSTLNIVNNEIKYKATVEKHYGDLPQVFCMSSQINQVLVNILVNAAHAIEKSGVITLTTSAENDWICIEIRDTGKGITEENLNKIFDPFFTTKPIGKGTGLGLSLSFGIIQNHGGRIDVSSELGSGSCFSICLPVCEDLDELQEINHSP